MSGIGDMSQITRQLPQRWEQMVNLRDRQVYQAEPNFTVVLPGPCQARCRFCIEPEGPRPETLGTFLNSFQKLCGAELPEIFRTLSLSGGEPTLSPALLPVLDLLKSRYRERFHRVVLTTNGGALHRYIEQMPGAITHVNVSRHASRDDFNRRVFKNTTIPSASALHEDISQLNKRGISVNLNCVYSSEHFSGERADRLDAAGWRRKAKEFISFAKSVGASSVVFRSDHRAIGPDETKLETAFNDYLPVYTDECPSCRVMVRIIRGLSVTFKQSAYEPTQLHPKDELYEMVLHSNGRLYLDWSRNQEVERPLPPGRWFNADAHMPPPPSGLAEECGRRHSCRPYMVFDRG